MTMKIHTFQKCLLDHDDSISCMSFVQFKIDFEHNKIIRI